jgi:hypothetical protein
VSRAFLKGQFSCESRFSKGSIGHSFFSAGENEVSTNCAGLICVNKSNICYPFQGSSLSAQYCYNFAPFALHLSCTILDK